MHINHKNGNFKDEYIWKCSSNNMIPDAALRHTPLAARANNKGKY